MTNRRKFSKEFFFKCFFVRYLRYLLENGIWEVRTILAPVQRPSEHYSNNDFLGTLTLLLDSDNVAELARLAVDLDAVVEELLKRGKVEDRIVHGDGAVNVELVERLASGCVLGSGGGFRLFENESY